MQVIKDIRLYKSDIENINGNSLPMNFMTKENNIVIERIVCKLREYGLVLGDFHHLYINFTTCLSPDTFQFSERSMSREFNWLRYVDYGVTADDFEKLGLFCAEYFTEKIEKILCGMFAKNNTEKENIRSSIRAALDEKEQMCAKYKEKKSAKHTAVIYLRITDSGLFFPLLVITENDSGKEILREDLPFCHGFEQYGTIQLSSKRIKINPRKNSIAESMDLKPIIFDF